MSVRLEATVAVQAVRGVVIRSREVWLEIRQFVRANGFRPRLVGCWILNSTIRGL
jgi:hypothetical protein